MKTLLHLSTLFGALLLFLTAMFLLARQEEPVQWIYFQADRSLLRMNPDNGVTQYVGEAPQTGHVTAVEFSEKTPVAYYSTFGGPSIGQVNRLNLLTGRVQTYGDPKDRLRFLATSPDENWIYAVDNTGILHRIERDSHHDKTFVFGTLYGSHLINAWSALENWVIVSDVDIGEIYYFDFDKNQLVNITNSSSRDYFVTLSPDEEWLYFESNRLPEWSIYRIHLDGTGIESVINARQEEFSRWSPDGEWMLFRLQSTDGQELFRCRPDGSDLQNLTNTPHANEYYEQYSPDGKWVYFISSKEVGRDVYRIKPDGSENQQITIDGHVAQFGLLALDYAWLVYQTYSVEYHEWRRIRSDGSQDQPVVVGDEIMDVDSWISDGKAIYVIWNDEYERSIYSLSLDNNSLRRLTGDLGYPEFFALSPILDLPLNPTPLLVLSTILIGGGLCVAYLSSHL